AIRRAPRLEGTAWLAPADARPGQERTWTTPRRGAPTSCRPHPDSLEVVAGTPAALAPGALAPGAVVVRAPSEHRSGLGRPANYFFGLYITGALKLTFLGRYIQPQIGRKPAGVLGSAFVGTALAAGWTPCVGPILGSILALAASAGQVKAGIILL